MRSIRKQAQSASPASSTSTSSSSSLSLPLLLLLPVLALLLLALAPQPCESRYLPTRSHGDELDKLRELMLQILELSNEDPQQQQQQQLQQQQHQLRLHNEANSPLTAQRGVGSAANAAWLQKLGAMGALDTEGGYARY